MTLASMVLTNLLRQRVRTFLTVVGIAVGIATVVALGAVTAGLRGTADEFVQAGAAQFVVAQEGAADLSFSRVPDEVVAQVGDVPGVAEASGFQLEVLKAGTNPFFFLGGVDPDLLALQQLDLVTGRLPAADDEVVLGAPAAADLGVVAGGTVELGGERLRVVGTYRSRVVWQEGGGFAPLVTVQRIADRPGFVTLVYVVVDDGADPDEVAAAVEEGVPGVVTISDADEYGRVDQGFNVLGAASTAISLLAVLVGGIGVMNTMVMSIFERTREIGVLRAVGWPARRVLGMVLAESVVLCLVAAVAGTAFGVLMVGGVSSLPTVSGLLVPAYPPSVFLRALVVALAVGLVGAVYPAVRATRLTPMAALRYE